jgi:mannosyltransferase OCH1-like enzyme
MKFIIQKKRTQNQIIKNNKLKLYRLPYSFLKSSYNPIMPLKIFQTWYTKDLPPKMRERVEILKQQNPRFEHHLFDNADCREFIKNHFSQEILEAYDSLIPGAYKADLWRLCVIYINGGIYMDIKFKCVNGFRLIELTENNHFVIDRIPPLTIYNALIASKKENPFILMAIHKIVENVKNKYYGSTPLSPTGPEMLGNLILNKKLAVNADLIHFEDGGYIIYKNRFVISTEYPEYNNERKGLYDSIGTKRYDSLWNERNIYK